MYQGSSLYVLTIPIVVYIVWRSARRREPVARVLALIALAVYVTELLSRTFFPLPVDAAYIALERASQYGSHNLVPFKTVSTMLAHPIPGVAPKQIAGNLVLFAPLGFFVPLLFGPLRDLRRAAAVLVASVLAVELGQLLLSVAVYRFAYKAFDVDDIWLNIVGALVGYGVYRVLSPGIQGSVLDQRPEVSISGEIDSN